MDFKTKNKLPVFWGILIAILQIILLKEVFQLGVVELLVAAKSSFYFDFPAFSYYFEPEVSISVVGIVLAYFAPYVYLVFSIELSTIFLKKLPRGSGRFFLIIFILIQIGYLLINIFYNAVVLILNPGIQNEWISLSIYLEFGNIERFLISFGMIFLFVFYLNISTKRVMKYINY